MTFFLPMNPPTVTHHDKELHAYMKSGKPHAVLHDSAALRDARAKLHAALAPQRPPEPLMGAIRLQVKWLFYSEDKNDGEYRITRPDTDNLDKLLKDVMTDLKYWQDDAQVACEIIEKFWARTPGVFVCVEAINP